MEEMNKLGLEDFVPDMELNIYDPKEDAIISRKISDYQGKWLVLFFYPADFTFVCPTELKDLTKFTAEYEKIGAEILVVSTDTAFSHKRRVETEELLKGFNIPMVSDRTADLSIIFGVLNKDTGNSERGTFIISGEGQIKSIEIVTEAIGRSSNDLLRKIQALDYVSKNPGHACPASWNTGAKTLKPSIKIAGHVGNELN